MKHVLGFSKAYALSLFCTSNAVLYKLICSAFSLSPESHLLQLSLCGLTKPRLIFLQNIFLYVPSFTLYH